MGTLIRIRNVCLSGKIELYHFFRFLDEKSVLIGMVFPGMILKKIELCRFSGSYSLKNGDTLFRKNVEKNSVFACLYSRQRVHFSNCYHYILR